MYSCVVVSIAQDVIYGQCTQQLLDKPTYETQPRKVSSCILLAFIAAFPKNESATTPALASWLPEALLLNGQALHNMRYIKHLRPAGMIHGLVYQHSALSIEKASRAFALDCSAFRERTCALSQSSHYPSPHSLINFLRTSLE